MKITREMLERWSGKLRAAATILDCQADEIDHRAHNAKEFREAAKDLRQSADQAFRASRAAKPPRRGGKK